MATIQNKQKPLIYKGFQVANLVNYDTGGDAPCGVQ